ncbi:hypothetical protein [Pseudaeromonas paramecii]|uniref:Cell envelope biogenesis protein TolA n=1 Tax=Pseudaeromonas paramecii TaxID=2138166 RepID=A0ABP8PWC4_9GAMM
MTTETTTLAVIEPANALALFSDRTGLDSLLTDIRQQATSLVPDLTTAKGRKEIASIAHAVARTKTYLDGIGKELTDQYKEIPKRIDGTRKELRDTLDALRDEVREPLNRWEAEQKAREEALAARLARIDELGNLPTQSPHPGPTVEQLTSYLTELEQTAIDSTWEDKAAMAAVARDAAIVKVKQALTARQQYDEQQAELERLRAEQAKRDQEERDRRIAEEAAQAEAQRQEQARLDAQRREQEALAREEQARQAAELAEQRRQEAEANAQRQAQEAAARAAEQERQRIEAEQQAKAQAEAARAADVEHRRQVNQQAVASLTFACALSPEQARDVISAIAKGLITGVHINY